MRGDGANANEFFTGAPDSPLWRKRTLAMKPASMSLSRALEVLREDRSRPSEKRRYRRMPLEISGRLRDANGGEFDCRTLNLSPGDARIATPAKMLVGDTILIYLNGLGRIEADVRRQIPEQSAYGVRFNITRHKLERHVDIIMGMLYPWARDEDSRRFPREASGGMVEVVLRDGRAISGRVVDISLVGISLMTPERPPTIGEFVSVSGRIGRVARYFEGGFAVDLRPTT
jgi:hypothetical protein